MGQRCCRRPCPAAIQGELEKKDVRLTLSITGLICSIAAVISIIAGILQLVYGLEGKEHGDIRGLRSGAPIWSGAVALFLGVFGICTALTLIPVCRRRILLYCVFGLSIAVANVTGQALGRITQVFTKCNGSLDPSCGNNPEQVALATLLALIVSPIIILCVIPNFVIYGMVHHRACKASSEGPCAVAPSEKTDLNYSAQI